MHFEERKENRWLAAWIEEVLRFGKLLRVVFAVLAILVAVQFGVAVVLRANFLERYRGVHFQPYYLPGASAYSRWEDSRIGRRLCYLIVISDHTLADVPISAGGEFHGETPHGLACYLNGVYYNGSAIPVTSNARVWVVTASGSLVAADITDAELNAAEERVRTDLVGTSLWKEKLLPMVAK